MKKEAVFTPAKTQAALLEVWAARDRVWSDRDIVTVEEVIAVRTMRAGEAAYVEVHLRGEMFTAAMRWVPLAWVQE